MTFPPAPSTSVDWNKLGLAVSTVNGHAQTTYNATTGQWSTPIFVQDPYLKVHGLCPGLNYGQQAYEGLKAFRTPHNTISIFRGPFHAKRMNHSAAAVSMPPVPQEVFLSAMNLAVARNAEFVPPHNVEGICYIRPVLFGSAPNLMLTPPDEYTLAIFVQPGSSYHGIKPLDAVVMEDFDRAAPKGTGNAKIGGNYAPVIKHQLKARLDGYGLTLHLDSQTRTEIEEFSTSGFIGVKSEGNSVTLILPDSKNVIESVTSDSCVELAKTLGWNVEIRAIILPELSTFTEVIAGGTAAGLLPIKSITRRSTGEKFLFQEGADEAGPVCVTLSAMMKAIQKGTAEDLFGWCTKVTEPKDEVVADGNGISHEATNGNGVHEVAYGDGVVHEENMNGNGISHEETANANGIAHEVTSNGIAHETSTNGIMGRQTANGNGITQETNVNGNAIVHETATNGNAVVKNGLNGHVAKINGHVVETNGPAAATNGLSNFALGAKVLELSSRIDALTAMIWAQQQNTA